MKCVTCGDEILPERVELGFTYCPKKACVRENAEGFTVVEIGQTKTNAEYVVLEGAAGERALTDMREGKYRRDPVVVKRESAATTVRRAQGPVCRNRKCPSHSRTE